MSFRTRDLIQAVAATSVRNTAGKVHPPRSGVTYAEPVRRLNEHGPEETEDSITSKLGRGTFSTTFLFAGLAVLGIAAIALADLWLIFHPCEESRL